MCYGYAKVKSLYPAPRITAHQMGDKVLLPVTRFQIPALSADCAGPQQNTTCAKQRPPSDNQSGMLGHSAQWHKH